MTDVAAEKKPPPVVAAVTGVVIALAVAWFLFGGGMDRQVAADMQHVNDMVADDAVKQYEIARRNGGKMDVCVHAGLVSAAYLQAKNETKYAEWRRTETADCKAAGIDR